MKSFSRSSRTASVVDDSDNDSEKAMLPKMAWEKRSSTTRDSSSSYLTRLSSKAWMKYLWSFIPTANTLRSRTHRYSHEYEVALSTDDDYGVVMDKTSYQSSGSRTKSTWLRCARRVFYSSPLIVLSFFGILHILFALCSRSDPFTLPEYDATSTWANFIASRKDHLTYPGDVTRDVNPIHCHSHNDYWRTVPLFDALRWGCTSVEADVWFYPGEDDLLVGHNSASLARNRTLRSLYVDPLVDLLDRMNPETKFNPGSNNINGVFDTNPDQTLILLIDFKTEGHALFPEVLKHLEPLRRRDYLSHWDGTTFVSRPITVVGTGNTPFDMVLSNPSHRNPSHREIFFDAPLDKLVQTEIRQEQPHNDNNNTHPRSPAQGNTGTSHTTPTSFNASNSYYASVPFTASIGLPLSGRLSTAQQEKIRAQIRAAHRQGLRARYWDTPAWPTSLRNYLWETLVAEGADVLNVDDLAAVAKRDWRERVEMGWFDG